MTCSLHGWTSDVDEVLEPYPAESSAGYGSRTSSTLLTKLENILDDSGEGAKRVEEMLGRTSSEDGSSKYLSKCSC
ncbi:hypothetical protein RB195_024542 [Necator americanus]|uniref:Uncharacterized protein n=1 Tax=Necator americanus TaxID=51031 RepID=A0ABR1EQW0_NECAM